MAISRMQEPRQLYGLGSLVKKITRPIKKIVKSPIGKAALLAAGAYFAPSFLSGAKFGFSGMQGPMALSKSMRAARLGRSLGAMAIGLGGAKGILGIGAGAGLLGGLFAKQPEETEEEDQARIEQLGPYLKQYYGNVGDTFGDQAIAHKK